MDLNFKKRMIFGVSVTPEVGIEVAQVDYEKKVLMNYVSKSFSFDSKLQGEFDLDIFKETLYDALVEIGAPQGSEIILNLPSTVFNIKDWPAAIDKVQLTGTVEDDVMEHPMFNSGEEEPVYSYCILPNSTIQSNKVAYTAAPKNIVLEIALQIKDLKYKLVAIDTSINSTLNALIYSERVDVSPDMFWVMLMVDGNTCRVISMQGRNYVSYTEERISIGKVLGDEENYSTVVNAVTPILKNTPSSLLYVISKTDIISAETLASKLSYKAQIVHQEDNIFNNTPFIDPAVDIAEEVGKGASLDIIGASIKKDFGTNSSAPFNLFNSMLGDVYLSQTYPIVKGIELSLENMLKYGVIIAVLILIISVIASIVVNNQRLAKEEKISACEAEIAQINKYLKEHEDISTQQFSETDEIRMGLSDNKKVYSYYTIVGTEIPKKLWLTSLKLGDQVTIEGQADNLESVYAFFRNIKDYNPESPIKLQKLGLAGNQGFGSYSTILSEDFDTESVLTSLNADFYEFVISNINLTEDKGKDKDKDKKKEKAKDNTKPNDKKSGALPKLEPLE